MVRDYGCLKTKASYTSKYHKCTVLENVFTHMGFQNSGRYDILLLGEFMNHTINKDDDTDYSAYMKVLKWGKPTIVPESSDGPEFLFPDIVVPDNISSFNRNDGECVFEFDGDNFEKARYQRSVLMQHEKGYKSMTTDELCTEGLNLQHEDFKNDVAYVCNRFNPEQVRANFHANIPPEKKTGMIYPDSLLPPRRTEEESRSIPKKKVKYMRFSNILDSDMSRGSRTSSTDDDDIC
jgi:hypothetical protein